MSEDLFESLLPPIKANFEPKVETIKEKSPPNAEIDLNKLWEDINSGDIQQSNQQQSHLANIDRNNSNKVIFVSNNKRKTPLTETVAPPSAKSMRMMLATGDDNRRIFQSALMNRNAILSGAQQQNQFPIAVSQPVENETHEEEEEGRANTEIYAQYQPAKLKKGNIHPYPVVESSSLSSVEPPNIRYNLKLPTEVTERGLLSRVQLEAVIYACQRHEERLPSGHRAGYLIGDGAGVGKGRTLAAIIYENYLRHRKRSIWLSASSDLRHDAERDFRDLGGWNDNTGTGIRVHALNKMRYAKINSPINGNVKKGVLYCTYASLIGECQGGGGGGSSAASSSGNNNHNSSSSSSNNVTKYKTRFKQITQWFGTDYDGVIVFDECHKAKNLMPQGSQKKTKTADLVLRLQQALPNARIVYASATGASEPRNMAYMTRLGLWGTGTPFGRFEDFVDKLEEKVGAMELIAVDMKQRGMYIARQLSFANVTFRVHEVSLANVRLGEYSFCEVYDESVALWNKMHSAVVRVMDMNQKYSQFNNNISGGVGKKKSTTAGGGPKYAKTVWGQFWAAHQRFFKYLVMAGKVQEAVSITMDAISQQKSVVIGLQSTGEAKTNEMLEEAELSCIGGELNEFVSCAKGILQTFVERFFPTRANVAHLESGGNSSSSARQRAANSKLGGNKSNRSSQGGSMSLQDALPRDFLEKVTEEVDTNDDVNNDDEEGDYHDDDDDDEIDDDYDDDDDNDVDDVLTRIRGSDNIDHNDYYDDLTLDDDGLGDNGLHKSGRQQRNKMMDDDRIARSLQQELLSDVLRLAPKLPINTLDALIRELGGTEYVAEMTGRKGRMVMDTNTGEVSYQSRREQDVTMEQVNLVEKERFNSCQKLVAIISDAASTGISLHADQRYDTPLPRVHITLELPWSADRAVQQFGRTHRSNQAHPPHYVLLISDLAGERRFACTVAKRLESLGALTHGDRRASESRDLSRFNVDNKFGRKALDLVFDHAFKQRPSLVPWKAGIAHSVDIQSSMEAVGLLPKDCKNVSKFLNRILGMPLHTQNAIFELYMDTMDELIKQAKKNQEFDRGIIDLAKEDDSIFVEDCRDFRMQFLGDDVKVQLHRVKSITGMSWASAEAIIQQKIHLQNKEGYYVTKSTSQRRIVLALRVSNDATGDSNKDGNIRESSSSKYIVYSPTAGETSNRLDSRILSMSYERIKEKDEAMRLWNAIYQTTETKCLHYYWHGHCRGSTTGGCDYGRRSKVRYVLSGSIFYIWDIIASMHKSPQLARVRLNDGSRIIGCLISQTNKDRIIEILNNRGLPPVTTTQQLMSANSTPSTVPLSMLQHQQQQQSSYKTPQPISVPLQTQPLSSMPRSLATAITNQQMIQRNITSSSPQQRYSITTQPSPSHNNYYLPSQRNVTPVIYRTATSIPTTSINSHQNISSNQLISQPTIIQLHSNGHNFIPGSVATTTASASPNRINNRIIVRPSVNQSNNNSNIRIVTLPTSSVSSPANHINSNAPPALRVTNRSIQPQQIRLLPQQQQQHIIRSSNIIPSNITNIFPISKGANNNNIIHIDTTNSLSSASGANTTSSSSSSSQQPYIQYIE